MTVRSATYTAVKTRHDWTLAELETLFDVPFGALVFQAAGVHRAHFPADEVQVSTLLSIKTGGCSEDCKYCSQSARYDTGLERERLLPVDEVLGAARDAQAAGATRFCMGAAWRNPKAKDMPALLDMVRGVKAMGLETCMTLGMLTPEQAGDLGEAGLDYYNHNLDTSPEFYGEVITTRTYDDRLDTLAHVRDAGMKVCCGGILGMGESRRDRASFLQQLANLPKHPESVPLNRLVNIPGTPLEEAPELDALEFVRTIAVARIAMPESFVRLSAGRETMSDELQALCFLAGANSIFSGDRLLTTPNAGDSVDATLFAKLGLRPSVSAEAQLPV